MAGNRLQEQVMIDNTGTPVITTTNWTYNNANQIATMQVGSNPVSNFQYDANGNLTSDGQLAYTWDRANRLITLNNGSYNTHYAYDGNSNRVQQTIGGIATDYLLDIQPQLVLVLKETTPSETLSYVHSPKGVHSVEDNTDNWHFMVSDGLGSVRSQVDDLAQVEASQAYSPYGQVYGVEGTFTGSFAYTGEQVDESGMSYLRARYYDPSQATFASLDPFEGKSCTPMSLNGYAYVHGNPILNTDPTGMMVAGRRVNIDTSGTSRILQSWSNTLKGAFTIPSLSLVKSMNTGMCGGRVGNVSKPDTRFYSRGGSSDIRQDTGTVSSLVHVSCNQDSVTVRSHPSFYGNIVGRYTGGSILTACEERADNPTNGLAPANWIRVANSEADCAGSQQWIRSTDGINQLLQSGLPQSCPNLSVPITRATVIPSDNYEYNTPGCIRGGTRLTGDESVTYQLGFILACESGAAGYSNFSDTHQAIVDIAHVINSRVKSGGFPNTLEGVISQTNAFQCYTEGSSGDISLAIGQAALAAQQLVNGNSLPPASSPEIEYAQFFFGLPWANAANNGANSIPRQDVLNFFTTADIVNASSSVLDGIYLGHGPMNSNRYGTFFFSDDPTFTGVIP